MIAFTVLGIDWYIALAILLALVFAAMLLGLGAGGWRLGRGDRR